MIADTQLVYEQIDKFNSQPSNPSQPKSDPVEKQRLFVVRETATKSAAFLGFLFEKNQIIKSKKSNIHNVIDIAFGSGNLTSRILLDNHIDFDKVVFNDKNLETSNKTIINNFEGKAEVSTFDFLDSGQFNFEEKFDMVVFNPQTGGKSNYPEGDSKLTTTNVINVEDDIETYLSKEGITTSDLEITEPSTTEILIESTTLSKTELGDLLKNIKIFNYHDVFYKGKSGTKGGIVSNVVKFRETCDKVFDENGILVFLGEESLFKTLFGDFNYVLNYWINGKKTDKNIFVAAKTNTPLSICYEKIGNDFVEIPNCEKKTEIADKEGDLDELENNINDLFKKLLTTTQDDSVVETPKEEEEEETSQQKEQIKEFFTIKGDKDGNTDFPYKNVLLKGVPGTGKSYLINKLIVNKLGLAHATHKNVLRVNIHSASSNADMMQGIGVSTNREGQISYHEKKGLILHHIQKAIEYPFQPFVIVLEEIQENSLNQLIGDLIYLIEDEKRVNIGDAIETIGETFVDIENFLDALNAEYFVEVPYLVSTETRYRKLVIPDNLYFFCTSNYRDDKKIVEDNLLRRFDLIEIYPTYDKTIFHFDENKDNPVPKFLEALNKSILKHFDKREIHPDRFMIGHASWLAVHNKQTFCRALLKAITEFKDIREIEFSDIKPVLDDLKDLPFDLEHEEILRGGYKTIIDALQKLAYKDILDAK